MKVTPKLQAVLDSLCTAGLDDQSHDLASLIETVDMDNYVNDEELFDTLDDLCGDLGRIIEEDREDKISRGHAAKAVLAINAAHRELASVEDPNWKPEDVVPVSELTESQEHCGEALEDLYTALDAIEELVLDGCCAQRPHKQDCKPAVLLRKYGRTVEIEGDPRNG